MSESKITIEKVMYNLMNHGYSKDQALATIGMFFKAYMQIDPDQRETLELLYSDNQLAE